MADVTMPQLGETVTEGTITRWFKRVGDSVARDEPLFEVSTDKVDSEVPSPAAGVLLELLVPEGETVEVGTRLAVIGDSVAATVTAPARPEAPAAPPVAPSAPPAAPPAFAPAPPPSPPSAAPSPPPPAPPPSPPSAAPSPPPPASPPSPPPSPAPTTPSPSQLEPEPRVAGGDARLLSPVVRRLLEENGIDPGEIVGTGLAGRITRDDVLSFIDARTRSDLGGRGAQPSAPPPPPPPPTPAQQPTPSAPPPSAAPPPPPSPPPPAPPPTPAGVAPPQPPEGYELIGAPEGAGVAPPPPSTPPFAAPPAPFEAPERRITFSNIRRRTAEHMVRSKSTSPHAFVATETDFENVERVRRAMGEEFRLQEGYTLTYLPFVARAAVEALREYPNLNASVEADSLVVYPQVNLGVAVDLDHEGLIVPVVHRAEELTLRGLARRIRELADRARKRQLGVDDVMGGTFSITNNGPFGTMFTVPIINQPQVAILATDGIKRRPVVVQLPEGMESIAIHSTGLLGMAFDHRAVDGAYVAAFLRRVTELISTRDWSTEL